MKAARYSSYRSGQSMKRSKSIMLNIVLAVAMFILPACNDAPKDAPKDALKQTPKEDEVCIDKNTHTVIDTRECEEEQKKKALNPNYAPRWVWYYMPHNAQGYTVGTVVSPSEGSFAPRTGSVAPAPGRVSAGPGGFGGSASGGGEAGE